MKKLLEELKKYPQGEVKVHYLPQGKEVEELEKLMEELQKNPQGVVKVHHRPQGKEVEELKKELEELKKNPQGEVEVGGGCALVLVLMIILAFF